MKTDENSLKSQYDKVISLENEYKKHKRIYVKNYTLVQKKIVKCFKRQAKKIIKQKDFFLRKHRAEIIKHDLIKDIEQCSYDFIMSCFIRKYFFALHFNSQHSSWIDNKYFYADGTPIEY